MGLFTLLSGKGECLIGLRLEVTNQPMKSLKRTDALHLEAAEGWLDLDNQSEAEAELNEIALQTHKHPDVLEVRWKISARGKNFWP